MSAIDETTAQVIRAASRRPAVKVSRKPTPFETWAWSPVIVLRVALVITYLLYVYAAVIAFIAGIPIFDLTTWEGYTPIWAVLVAAGAIVSSVGALTEHWEKLEKWASLGLSSLLAGYTGALNIVAYGSGDLGRQFVGAIALIAMVLPATRFVYLAAQTGKRAPDAVGRD